MEVRDYVDGIILLSQKWTVLKQYNPLTLNCNMFIKNVEENQLRGMNCLRKRRNTILSMQDVNNMQSGVLVSLPPENGSKKDGIDWRLYRRAFIAAVDFAVTQLKGSKTKKHWQSRCCSKFVDWAARRETPHRCSCSRSHSLLTVFGEDIAEWGEKFNMAFLSLIRSYPKYKDIDVQIYTIIHRLGQNMSIEGLEGYLGNFNLNYYPFGKGLQAYFPAFTSAYAGNFKWVFSENTRVIDMPAPTVQEMKFYSNIAKELHRAKPAPYSYPTLMSIFINNAESDRQRVFETNEGWIRAVLGNINNLNEANCIEARVECILLWSSVNLVDACKTMHQTFVNTMDYFTFHEFLTPDIQFDEFHFQQIRGIFIPLTKTLSELIGDWKEKLTENTSFMPAIDDLTLAVCIEAMLSWWCYGTLKSPEWKHGFSNKLADYLHLNSLSWFIDSGNFVAGIPESCPLKKRGNRVVLEGIYKKDLIYCENWTSDGLLTTDLLDKMFEALSDLKYWVTVQGEASELENQTELDNMIEDSLEVLSEIVYRILKFENDKCLATYGDDWDNLRKQHIQNRDYVKVETVRCKELVDKIANAQHLFQHQHLQQLFSSVKKVCSEESYEIFKQTCSNLLERELWASAQLGSMLTLFNQTKRLFVLPTYCTDDEWKFLNQQQIRLQILLQNFKAAIQMKLGPHVIVDIEHIHAVLYEIHSNSTLMMNDVFQPILENWYHLVLMGMAE